MANLPTHLTNKQIADLPWLNGVDDLPPKLDVTGHSGNDITKFRDALYESKIPTKEVVKDGVTYVEVATDVPGVRQNLETIRLKHLPLVDGSGNQVVSYKQFKSNTPLERADIKFIDLSPNASAGARAENPAALQSLQNVFRRLGQSGNEISDGKFKVLASEPNAKLLKKVGAITGEFNFESPSSVKLSTTPIETSPPKSSNYFNIPDIVKLSDTSIETTPVKVIAKNIIEQSRLNPGLVLGAAITTTEAVLAAEPALRKGEYADAALLALNSSVHLGAELALVGECTAEVITAAAPLAPSAPAYAGAVVSGGAVCAIGSHYFMAGSDEAAAIIQARVKEVAASNGLDPEHIWASMLEKAQGQAVQPTDAEPAQER